MQICAKYCILLVWPRYLYGEEGRGQTQTWSMCWGICRREEVTVCTIITVTIGVDVIVQRQSSSQQQIFPWFHPFNRKQNVEEEHNGLEWRARTTRTVSVFLDLSELKSDKSVARLGNCQVIINKCKSVGSLEEFYHKFWSITSSSVGVFEVGNVSLWVILICHHSVAAVLMIEALVVLRPTILTLLPGLLLGHSSKHIFWIFL